MTPIQTLLTAEELLSLPDDGFRRELVKGELRNMTPSGGEHAVISARLARFVDTFVSAHALGLVFGAEGGFQIASDPDTVRAPDLAFVRSERIPESGVPTGFVRGAPDLAAEVVSPNDRYEEVAEKTASWLEAGAEIVWVVNPRARAVTVHSADGAARILTADENLDGGSLLPGFTCPVAELFP